jgi:hypothetical protein
MVELPHSCNWWLQDLRGKERASGMEWATYHEEEVRMRRMLAVAVLALGVMTFIGNGLSWAAKTHEAEAIDHTQAAVEHGKAGHASVVVEHATVALQHAEAAQKAKANDHTAAAIKGLKEAVEHGKAGHADVAGKAAAGALEHLKAVK